MQDTSTNAMTEVALGLSMAFFSLLVLALLSMSAPMQVKPVASHLQPSDLQLSDLQPSDLQQQSRVKLESNQQGQGEQTSQFAFYFKGGFYDQTLKSRKIESFPSDQSLVLAIDKNMTFSQVFNLRQQINHPKLSITTLNDEWLNQLEQM